ncbi:hypothetical protein ACHAXR_012828 [Thalassiosira sp. AJA248-18]
METLPRDLAEIGIGCCVGHLYSPGEIEYESTECTTTDSTTSPLKPRTRMPSISRKSSSLRRGSKNLITSLASSLNSAGSSVSSTKAHETVSASEVAKIVSYEYFAEEPKPQLFSISSLSYDTDHGGDVQVTCYFKEDTATATTGSESQQDTLALEVGKSAHEYLEECFYTEVSILNREKFNAIPEIVKSDFTITAHLGKGSYSDVFEVVCKAGQLKSDMSPRATGGRRNSPRYGRELSSSITGATALLRPPKSNELISDMSPGVAPGRPRTRSRRSTMSSSITTGTLARPSRCNELRVAFAMKCLRPQIRSNVDQFIIGAEDLVHETAILANLSHHHIIKLHGRAEGHLTDAFALNDGYFILLDKLEETLKDRIDVWKRTINEGPTVELEQIGVAHSIADAMSYLHSKKIAFRDLKPANVGFDSLGVLKLFDFGFAIGLPEKSLSNPSGYMFDRCGTPRYMAPEVGLSSGYGLPADVHSFGVLIWEMFAFKKPFSSIKSSEAFDREVFLGGLRPVMKDRWPTTMKDLMSNCWSASPSKRPTMLDVKSILSDVMTGTGVKTKTPVAARSRMMRRRTDFAI